jgi:hypothetical protein
MTLCLVDSTTARVALHQSACSRGYKLSREGTDARSLRVRCVCVRHSEVCVHLSDVCVRLSEVCVHASPFIVSKGRARVIFVVKKVK